MKKMRKEQIDQKPSQQAKDGCSSKRPLIMVLVLFLLLGCGIAVSVSLLSFGIGRVSEADNNVITLVPPEEAPSESGGNAVAGVMASPQSTTAETSYVTGQSDEYRGELQAHDDLQTWDSETEVELFRDSYDGTVKSDDKEKVIAPGTSNFYDFALKNNGNIPLDYSVSLKVGTYLGEKDTYSSIPLEWRLLAGDGTALSDWSGYNERTEVLEQGTLKVRNQNNYTVEWRWNYEQGETMDTADTDMGDLAMDRSLGVNAEIYVHAEQSAAFDGKLSASEDGKKAGEENDASLHGNATKTGDTFDILPYIVLMTISACGILIFFMMGRRRKKDEVAADDRK